MSLNSGQRKQYDYLFRERCPECSTLIGNPVEG